MAIKKRIQQRSIQIILLLFVTAILFYSRAVVGAAQQGLLLWFNLVLPSLFPFAVGTYLLIEYGLIQWIGSLFEPLMRPLFKISGVGAFAWIMGMTSSYPMGAMITADLVKKEEISIVEGQRLLSLSNQSGPLFILGAVSVGILQWPEVGIFLLGIHYLSAISIGFLFRFYKSSEASQGRHKKKRRAKTIAPPQLSLGAVLKDSVVNAMDLLLQIGGFIILFSVIIEILTQSQITVAFRFLFPLIEVTNGIQLINETTAPILQKILLVNGAIAWGGLSIHAQTASILQGSQLKMSTYLIGKGMQGILACIYTIAFFPLIVKRIPSPTFYAKSIPWRLAPTWSSIIMQSTIGFGAICFALLVIGLVCYYFLFPRNS